MKHHKSILIFAAVIGFISISALLLTSVRIARVPAIEKDAVVLANSVATNLAKTKDDLSNIAKQPANSGISINIRGLQVTFSRCLDLAQDLKQRGSPREADWAREIETAVRSGKESIRAIEAQSTQIYQTKESAMLAEQQLSEQTKAIGKLVTLVERQQSTKSDSSPIAITTALIGLLGSVSTIMLAWRSDSREMVKLQIELEKMRFELANPKSPKKK